MEDPRGPAAVTGDEPRESHCPDLVVTFGWEGADSRLSLRSQNTSFDPRPMFPRGWGSGEDEESGAILKVIQALGIFYFEQPCIPFGFRHRDLVGDVPMRIVGHSGFGL